MDLTRTAATATPQAETALPSGRVSAGVAATALWALAVGQLAFCLTLALLNRLSLERFLAEYIVFLVAATLSFATVGLLICRRRPGNLVGWLLLAAGVGFGMAGWLQQYARYTLVTDPGSLPAGNAIAWLYFWTWIPVTALAIVYLPLLFPDGRPPWARWRPVAWVAGAATVSLSVMLALSPGPLDDTLPEVSNPLAPAWAEPVLTVLNPIAIVLVLTSLAGAAAAPVARYRRAQDTERQQLKWFAYAAVLVVVAYVLPAALDPSGFTEDTLLSATIQAAAVPLLPAAVGIAILRYRLFDIDLLINRTLVYAALTAGVVGVYVLVVGTLGALVRSSGVGGDLLVSVAATGVVAIIFQPLRTRLQQGVDRLLFGERDDPYAVLSRLGRRLEETLAPEAVLPAVAATVAEALKLPYVAIALDQGPGGPANVVAASGVPSEPALRLPLVYGSEALGELVLAARAPGEAFTTADRRLLEDLARQAGIAVHAVRLSADLQRSRERLVTAREEERRRLRRDLHDGLGPALSSAILKLGAARRLLPPDAETTGLDALVDEVRSDLRAVVADVRRLVHDLRPPVLDQLGLVLAVRELAGGYGETAGTADGPVPRVRVEAPDALPPLPAAVEVAAFRIAQEAVTNVVRHARATICTLRLAVDGADGEPGRMLRLEVVDDGIGLPPVVQAGVGLVSMRERAAELGGTLEVEPVAAGGTRVVACLPLPAP